MKVTGNCGQNTAGAAAFPLNPSQTGVWFGHNLARGGSTYSTGQITELRGAIDPAVFALAARHVVAEIETLRLRFAEGPDGPFQWVSDGPATGWSLPIDDLTTETDCDRAVADRAQALLSHPFDLAEEALLFRWRLIRLAADHFIWVQIYHHLIIDGLGGYLVVARMAAVYSALLLGEAPRQFVAAPLRRVLEDPAYGPSTKAWAEDRRAWLEAFGDRPRGVSLSSRPDRGRLDFIRVTRRVGPRIRDRLEALGEQVGATLPAVLTAAVAAYLARLQGQEEVLLGLQVAGRLGAAARRTPAMMTNVAPLRLRTPLDGTVGELMREAVRQTRFALKHQRYPHEVLRRDLGLNPTGPDIFSVALNIMPIEPAPMFGAAPGRTQNLFNGPVKDLMIVIHDGGDEGLTLHLKGSTDRYSHADLAAHGDRLPRLLEGLAASRTESPIGDIVILSDQERDQLLVEWNATEADYPSETCIHELFEGQVARDPGAIAVVFEGEQLTYGELNARANPLAHHLLKLGVGPDDRVGICVERGLDMVVGLLAVLKAGGAYVPLDPAYPADRLAYMVEDSAPVAILTHGPARSVVEAALAGSMGSPIIDLDTDRSLWVNEDPDNPRVENAGLTPSHLAYVIYTSGSTGRPKGAMNEHRAVVNRLWWMHSEYGLKAGDAVLQKTPFSFDVSVWEIFWPLIAGARLVMARPEGHKDPAYLLQIIRSEAITTLHFVPSMLGAFLGHLGGPEFGSVRTIVTSGEALPLNLARLCLERFPQAGLHNLYGPTEAAVDVTAWTVVLDGASTEIPIGRPISNARIYLLDEALRPVPIGATGEIHIGGVPVGRGYLNRPDLTAERFIDNPFAPGERLYKTGDLARWRPDGNIESLGRNDFQVKIRGFRIELGEIEARLASHPSVREAVVLAREDSPGDRRLAAYYLVRAGSPEPAPEDLRAHLAAALPEPMTPAAFVRLDAFPLTPNGKLDRKALPAPEADAYATRVHAPPIGEVEQTLARLWSESLGIDSIGRDDNFFDLGGHSLLAMRLLARIETALGRKLALGAFIRAPTIARLAGSLERGFAASDLHSFVPLQTYALGQPIFMIHLIERDLGRHLGARHVVHGLSFGLAVAEGRTPAIPKTVEALAAHYIEEMRAVQPGGPYRLIGHSFGGIIAYEMARQLSVEGETPAFLGLLDTHLMDPKGRTRRFPVGRIARNHVKGLAEDLGKTVRGLIVATRRAMPASPNNASISRELDDAVQPLFRFLEEPYRAKPYEGAIHLFRATKTVASVRDAGPRSPEESWRKLAVGEFHVHKLPGGHMDLVKDPGARQTAAAILEVLGEQSRRSAPAIPDIPASLSVKAQDRGQADALELAARAFGD